MLWQVKLLLYAGGIYVCFLAYGVLLENIERGRYGEQKEAFHFWLFTALGGSLVNMVVAYVALVTSKESLKVVCPEFLALSFLNNEFQLPTSGQNILFAAVSACQSFASATSLTALEYVDFPTQTLGKCAKPISVLVSGLFFGKKSTYSFSKAVTAVLVCVGVSVFMVAKDGSSATSIHPLGVSLLIASLVAGGGFNVLFAFILSKLFVQDGFVGELQNGIRSQFSAFSMMFFISLWSYVWMMIATVVNGQLLGALLFIQRFPSVLGPLIGTSLCLSIGQLFIFKLISDFDPLVCSLTTTTRKFFSILGSVIIYGTRVNTVQWIGCATVFVGLLYPEMINFWRKQHKKL